MTARPDRNRTGRFRSHTGGRQAVFRRAQAAPNGVFPGSAPSPDSDRSTGLSRSSRPRPLLTDADEKRQATLPKPLPTRGPASYIQSGPNDDGPVAPAGRPE